MSEEITITDADRESWQIAAERSYRAFRQALSPCYWPWRARMTWMLVLPPFRWKLVGAWKYSAVCLANELEDFDPTTMLFPTPQDALDNDRQYWDD